MQLRKLPSLIDEQSETGKEREARMNLQLLLLTQGCNFNFGDHLEEHNCTDDSLGFCLISICVGRGVGVAPLVRMI